MPHRSKAKARCAVVTGIVLILCAVLFWHIYQRHLLDVLSASESRLTSLKAQLNSVKHWRQFPSLHADSTFQSKFSCPSLHRTSDKPFEQVDGEQIRADRSRICYIRNFCISHSKPGFIIVPSHQVEDPNEIPFINVMSVDRESDQWWKPETLKAFPARRYRRINKTLAIYGMYSPYHLTHHLMNGALPLFSVLRYANVSFGDTYLYRVASVDERPSKFPLDYAAFDGKEILRSPEWLSPEQVDSEFQMSIPGKDEDPICFERAIVGTGNRCPLAYCDNAVSAQTIAEFRAWTLSYFHYTRSNANANHRVISLRNHEKAILSNDSHRDSHSSGDGFTIGLMNRLTSRTLVNMDDVAEKLSSWLKSSGNLNVSILAFDLDSNNVTREDVALLFSGLDVLVSPHGSGMGNALWMKPKSTVLSVTQRYAGGDPFFTDPFLAMGIRMTNWECSDDNCTVGNDTLAQEMFRLFGVYDTSSVFTSREWDDIVLQRLPWEGLKETLSAKIRTNNSLMKRIERGWHAYFRAIPRSVSVSAVISTVQDMLENREADRNTSFPDMCGKNRCCVNQNSCLESMRSVIFETGPRNAWLPQDDRTC